MAGFQNRLRGQNERDDLRENAADMGALSRMARPEAGHRPGSWQSERLRKMSNNHALGAAAARSLEASRRLDQTDKRNAIYENQHEFNKGQAMWGRHRTEGLDAFNKDQTMWNRNRTEKLDAVNAEQRNEMRNRWKSMNDLQRTKYREQLTSKYGPDATRAFLSGADVELKPVQRQNPLTPAQALSYQQSATPESWAKYLKTKNPGDLVARQTQQKPMLTPTQLWNMQKDATPESIAMYRKTGNPGYLIPRGGQGAGFPKSEIDTRYRAAAMKLREVEKLQAEYDKISSGWWDTGAEKETMKQLEKQIQHNKQLAEILGQQADGMLMGGQQQLAQAGEQQEALSGLAVQQGPQFTQAIAPVQRNLPPTNVGVLNSMPTFDQQIKQAGIGSAMDEVRPQGVALPINEAQMNAPREQGITPLNPDILLQSQLDNAGGVYDGAPKQPAKQAIPMGPQAQVPEKIQSPLDATTATPKRTGPETSLDRKERGLPSGGSIVEKSFETLVSGDRKDKRAAADDMKAILGDTDKYGSEIMKLFVNNTDILDVMDFKETKRSGDLSKPFSMRYKLNVSQRPIKPSTKNSMSKNAKKNLDIIANKWASDIIQSAGGTALYGDIIGGVKRAGKGNFTKGFDSAFNFYKRQNPGKTKEDFKVEALLNAVESRADMPKAAVNYLSALASNNNLREQKAESLYNRATGE